KPLKRRASQSKVRHDRHHHPPSPSDSNPQRHLLGPDSHAVASDGSDRAESSTGNPGAIQMSPRHDDAPETLGSIVLGAIFWVGICIAIILVSALLGNPL